VAAAGLGRLLQGGLEGNPAVRQQGLDLARIGIALFLAFAVFFELFIFNQSRAARHLIPLALIVIGIYLLLRGKLEGAGPGGPNPPP
jgi:drug/metabolite transporter (DMT)-like permease